MRAAHRQWASWFWILFGGNDDRGSHLDAAPEKDQEYQVVRIIGKDTWNPFLLNGGYSHSTLLIA
jgi:hypothetical protein